MRLNLSNFLTSIRLLGAPLIPLFFLDFRVGVFLWALFLALTDLADGAFAKWLGQETKLGERLDPLADFSYCLALFATVLIVYRNYYNNVALFWCWVFSAGYFAWYAVKVMQLRRSGKINKPNREAKWGMGVLMTSLLLVLVGTIVTPYFVWHAMASIGTVVSVILTLAALEKYERLQCANCTCSKH